MLESSDLVKSEDLEVDKTILDSVYLLYVIYERPTRFRYKIPYKNISTNRHTNTNETFRNEERKTELSLMNLCVTPNTVCCVTLWDTTSSG
jgi:hypothetical protein